MGIQGLLPFLKKIHTPVNISQFSGSTVAIDAYCWLHKGAFSCADKLALGEKTEQYVYYCMKYVDMLLRNGLKPILVFDGCHLPSKKDVETSRRERRELNRKRAAQLLREGKRAEARECLQRCIDITPQMALELMNVCRSRGVDCIVAPYEADAQLAYLNKVGIAQIIITEDSDLLLFGCEKVIFKMDFFGNGVLIEQSRLNEVADMRDGFYTFDKFRYMCILSGCDYLPSLPGIGLVKACKVFKIARQTDLRQLLRKIPSYLKMSLVVTDEYIEGFIRADNTFLYQLAFDPLTRKLCPLTPYPPEIEPEELRYAGPYFSNQRALQIALGNTDVHTHEKIADFDPDTYVPKYVKNQKIEMLHMLSIWNPGYRPRSKTKMITEADSNRPCLAGREVQVKNMLPKKSPVKRVRQVEENADIKTDTELMNLYSRPDIRGKRKIDEDDINTIHQEASKLSDNANSFDSDEGDEDPKSKLSKKSLKKQVLSPSKLTNQACMKTAEVTADNAISLMEQEPGVEESPEQKENGRHSRIPSKRNKFAVSALAKRAKFSLDAPAVPGIKVEVKSRYFGSTSGTSVSSTSAQQSNSRVFKPDKDKEPSPQKAEGESSVASSTPASTASDLSRNEVEETSSSPWLSSKKTSSLSKFDFRSNSPSNVQVKTLESTGFPKAASSAKRVSESKKTSKSSPGSVFNWASFKFTKSNSLPDFSASTPASSGGNHPFRRVVSESKQNEEAENTFQTPDLPGDQGDTGTSQQDNLNDCNDASQKLSSSVCTQSGSPDSSQRNDSDDVSDFNCSQLSAVEADASQRSNLYSIDSDCFPGSQDIVDLTDNEVDSHSVKSKGDLTSATSSKVSLKSPKATPTNKSDTKKCRVSGLSRGKKKSPGVDSKQQKIQDMFSRFAHHKKASLEHTPETTLDMENSDGYETPSNQLRDFSAGTHRKLIL